jgi:hypothetical protein
MAQIQPSDEVRLIAHAYEANMQRLRELQRKCDVMKGKSSFKSFVSPPVRPLGPHPCLKPNIDSLKGKLAGMGSVRRLCLAFGVDLDVITDSNSGLVVHEASNFAQSGASVQSYVHLGNCPSIWRL